MPTNLKDENKLLKKQLKEAQNQVNYWKNIAEIRASRGGSRSNFERERERERERENFLTKIVQLNCEIADLYQELDLLTTERDNYQSSAKIAQGKLRKALERREHLKIEFENEKLSHQLTLNSVISLNRQRENLLNENDTLRNELGDSSQQIASLTQQIDQERTIAKTFTKNQRQKSKNQASTDRAVFLNRICQLKNDLGSKENAILEKNQDYTELEQAGERLLIAYRNKEQEINGLQTQLTNQQNLNQTLQNQIDNHVCLPCPLIHLPAPHTCPITEVEKLVEIEKECPHADYEEIKKQRDNYQQQLTDQEKAIIERLNNAFNFQAQDLDQAISKLKELIDKLPLTVDNEVIKQELEQTKEIITRLEKELKVGEKIETIIQINVEKLQEIIPRVEHKVIEQAFAKADDYEQISAKRNELIVKYLNNTVNKQVVKTSNLDAKLAKQQNQERTILISLLAVSLISISGLLYKLKKLRKK